MKILKASRLVLLLTLASLLPACRSSAPTDPQAAMAPPELTETPYLQMVMRYLYRWQLDEAEFKKLLDSRNIVFWIRPLRLKLDPGDHSQFAEILLPQINLSMRVKKADYTIREVATPVKSKSYKIIRVMRGEGPRHRPAACTVVQMESEELRDFLFRNRSQRDFFDPVIVQHLRQVAQDEAAKEGILATNILGGQQLINIAPLSPAANETWVLWEIRRKLFHISSDIDLADPAVWKYQTLKIRSFDLNEQVVVSREEVTGSNFYLNRYQISRALFNCIVLGQRIDVPPR